MRKKIIAGNWKMNITKIAAQTLLNEIAMQYNSYDLTAQKIVKVIKKNIVDESHEEEEVLILEKSRGQLSN